MTTRQAVLQKIRAALADVPTSEQPDDVPVPRDYLRSHAGPDPVVLFAERVADYQATVIHCTPASVSETIAAALATRGVAELVVPSGFPADWLGDLTFRSDEPALTIAELDTLDGALTTAAVGIAVTGTIVLDAGPGQGRRTLTLVPDYHLCVVQASQIATDVPDALAQLDPTRPLTFISGPSATSDIELNRVEGVHGPRTLDVIVVDDRPQESP